MTGQIFKNLEHIFLFYERHLTVDLCKLRLTVSTKILIAETLRNLEIAVETRNHQQLLQRLRTLGQGIELTGIHTTGDYEITGSLRSRTNQYRCLYLNKLLPIKEITDEDGHLMSQLKILAYSGTAQIQVTIFHTDIISTIGIVLNSKGRRETFTENRQSIRHNFNIPRRHLRIFALALTHHTFYLNTKLATQFIGLFTERGIL